jgi:MoaA/NifB/PqqE/SkfB family radical SAM enzyme
VFDLPDLSKVARSLWGRYGTARKKQNAERLREQTVACVEGVDAYPWRVILEPGNICNLRCKGCLTHDSALPKGLLEPAQVEHYLDALWPFLVQVNLFNWGEPFLHPRLSELIGVIHGHGVGTHVHSNMNHLPNGLAEGLCDAGLDFLVASIDGITQDVYAQYRAGGCCQEALRNLEAFVKIRHAKGISSPKIIWRLLCFPHNVHQIEDAARLAREIGVDEFAVSSGGLDGQTWSPGGPMEMTAATATRAPPSCTDLYDFPAIHWDGTVLPCCFAMDPSFVWGDLRRSSWREAFNSGPFRTARRLARGDPSAEGSCLGCPRLPTAAGIPVS